MCNAIDTSQTEQLVDPKQDGESEPRADLNVLPQREEEDGQMQIKRHIKLEIEHAERKLHNFLK